MIYRPLINNLFRGIYYVSRMQYREFRLYIFRDGTLPLN